MKKLATRLAAGLVLAFCGHAPAALGADFRTSVFKKFLVAWIVLAVAAPLAQAADGDTTIDTIACASESDAEAIVTAALAEPTLEDGYGLQAEKMANDKLVAGLCGKAELDRSYADQADRKHSVDGLKFGVVQLPDGWHAVVMDFTSNFF
jgi:hypothetical protein